MKNNYHNYKKLLNDSRAELSEDFYYFKRRWAHENNSKERNKIIKEVEEFKKVVESIIDLHIDSFSLKFTTVILGIIAEKVSNIDFYKSVGRNILMLDELKDFYEEKSKEMENL